MDDGSRPDVSAWAGVELVAPISGGARSDPHLARRGGERFVVRRSTRPQQALRWELDVADHLEEAGLLVPSTVPTDDGRRHHHGVLVQRLLPGRPPRTDEDWRCVRTTIDRLHRVTEGWGQRPGFAGAQELMTSSRGGDVALDAMPEGAVALVRDCWRPLVGGATCVVHGDIGAGNLLVDGKTVGLIDWDESRVDVPGFDLGNLPASVVTGSPIPVALLQRAALAWEVATCWVVEPDYAVDRLAELRQQIDR
jgi:Ser/Thr protein kinase RdoA (MazF antagonist)